MPKPLRIIAGFFIFFAFEVSAKSSSEHTPLNLSEIVKTAETIATEYHNMGWFSGSLLVAKDGEVVFTESYGYQEIKQGVPNTKHTKFNLGSIMKNFTKVLVLQQVATGQLSLTDKLSKFELGFPVAVANKITIEQLLNHSSGFADVFTAEYRENQLTFDSLNKKLEILKHQPLLFEPGTDHRYSNYGYIVLGAVLEKVTSQSFEQLLVNRIFNPLKLKGTTFKADANHKFQSQRYTYLYDSSLKKVGVTEHPGPDGGIESTVNDVQKFYRALFYSDKLLRRTDEINNQAFAMSGEHWGSYGGGLGVSAAVEVNLKHGFEVVVLANTDSLVAELISTRIQAFIKTGFYEPVRALETNFAYKFYKEKRKAEFYKNFKAAYVSSGYTQFIGRTINELGMQLLRTKSWQEAFDIFDYLVSIFPKAPQAYDSLAYAFLSKGNSDKAYETFKKALNINKSFNSDYIKDNYGHGSED